MLRSDITSPLAPVEGQCRSQSRAREEESFLVPAPVFSALAAGHWLLSAVGGFDLHSSIILC